MEEARVYLAIFRRYMETNMSTEEQLQERSGNMKSERLNRRKKKGGLYRHFRWNKIIFPRLLSKGII